MKLLSSILFFCLCSSQISFAAQGPTFQICPITIVRPKVKIAHKTIQDKSVCDKACHMVTLCLLAGCIGFHIGNQTGYDAGLNNGFQEGYSHGFSQGAFDASQKAQFRTPSMVRCENFSQIALQFTKKTN